MSSSITTFEYQRKSTETPFETFLRYTNEKELSANVLAQILKKILSPQPQLSILDIGTGNGEYLERALSEANLNISANITLLEPSRDLVTELQRRIPHFPSQYTCQIIQGTWEQFQSHSKFDCILASHLYHIKREDYFDSFSKMIDYLKPKGRLMYVLRQIDDAYHFKMSFKPRLFGEQFQAKTLEESLQTFTHISERQALEISLHQSVSQLSIPLETNFEDAVAIIEFYLNKPWSEISPALQSEIIGYIKAKKCIFEQIDGIAVIAKQ